MDINTAFATPGQLVVDLRTGKYFRTTLQQSTQRLPLLAPCRKNGNDRPGDYVPVRKADRKHYCAIVLHRALPKITAAHINRELAKMGIEERITQGRGYVYFHSGDSSSWYSSSIPVCYVSDLVGKTLAETMATVLRERTALSTFNR